MFIKHLTFKINHKDIRMFQPQQSQEIVFPKNQHLGIKFKDLQQFRNTINNQARQNNKQEMTRWYKLEGVQQNCTIMKCKVSNTCKAFIKLFYAETLGFYVDSMQSKHDHSPNTKIKQVKQNTILAPYIGQFQASKTTKNIDDVQYIVRTNCCCKSNPGTTAIAYDIINQKGEIVLENSKKFEDFTNNKAQFTVIMYAMMDCFQHGIKNIQIKNRSKLIVDFMNDRNQIKAHGLRQIAEAAKMLRHRIQCNKIQFKIMDKGQSSVKLQNTCRKLLGLNQKNQL